MTVRGRSPLRFQYQDRNIPLRREIGLFHFELRRPDPLHALTAEAHEIIRRTFVDDEAKILDRSGPVCPGLEHIVDAPLTEVAPGLCESGQQILVWAIFAVVGLLQESNQARNVDRNDAAHARLVAMLDDGLAARDKF